MTSNTDRFLGQVALVTGGTSGIGEATCVAYAKEGAKVVVNGLNEERGHGVVKKIESSGGTGVFIKADVSKATEVEGLIGKTVEIFGRLDVAFNNAGIQGIGGPIHEYPEEAWNRSIDINLKGVFLCMKYQINQMLTQSKRKSAEHLGSIVNMSSIIGLIGNDSSPDYCATKHGVLGLTKSAVIHYENKGIRINSVCPASIRTPMFDRYVQGDQNQAAYLESLHPIGRVGEPEEVAEAVLWLSSEKTNFITGTGLLIDGGYLAR